MAFLSSKRTWVLAALFIAGAILLALPFLLGEQDQYPIDPQDRIASWQWQGAYADSAHEQDTKAEIRRLKAMLGMNAASAYDVYVGIASQYELLGDGKDAYRYLSRAIATDPQRAIAYLNMGHLMEELGAPATAEGAYEKAAALDPGNAIYADALVRFRAKQPVQ